MKRAIIAGVLWLGFMSPVFAIDMTQVLKDADGKPAHEKDANSPLLTLGDAIAGALFVPPQATQPQHPGMPTTDQDPIKLAKRAALGIRLRESKDFTPTADETVEIKNAIAVYPPVTVLRILEIIDPASLK